VLLLLLCAVAAIPAALQLASLDSLLGSHGTHCIMGMITQPSEGAYALEDLTCSVPLDLSNAHYTAGLFTENCIVVAEGEMLDGAFHVHMVSAAMSVIAAAYI
jgi:hypothetical protein